MLWSYSDLFAVRLIRFLRSEKFQANGAQDQPTAPSTMKAVRSLLASVDRLGERLSEAGVLVWVEPTGKIRVQVGDDSAVFEPRGLGGFGQVVAESHPINLVVAFRASENIRAPDLFAPKPTLRIIPGKLASEPHVLNTRIPTLMVARLADSGFDQERIQALYPALSPENVTDSITLEVELANNIKRQAA